MTGELDDDDAEFLNRDNLSGALSPLPSTMELEQTLAGPVKTFASFIETALLQGLHITLLPIIIPLRVARASAPPIFHTILLLSLFPPLLFFSLSAGVATRRWVPRGWSEVAYLQYG